MSGGPLLHSLAVLCNTHKVLLQVSSQATNHV